MRNSEPLLGLRLFVFRITKANIAENALAPDMLGCIGYKRVKTFLLLIRSGKSSERALKYFVGCGLLCRLVPFKERRAPCLIFLRSGEEDFALSDQCPG